MLGQVILAAAGLTATGVSAQNWFGLQGHSTCKADDPGGDPGGAVVGKCYNDLECLAMGGSVAGDCQKHWSQTFSQGVCCVMIQTATGISSSSSNTYTFFRNEEWPSSGSGDHRLHDHRILPLEDTCQIRLDYLTLEITQMDGNCVHDRVQILGDTEPSGSLCGDRSGEATLHEVTKDKNGNPKPIELEVSVQSKKWRWNIGITQISCDEVNEEAARMMDQAWGSDGQTCGAKNPSESNRIGSIDVTKKKGHHTIRKHDIPSLNRKKAKRVFKQLKKLPTLTEAERANLKIYKPSFTRQELNYEKANFNPLGRSGHNLSWKQKGRILYGNETDVSEYPWQVSMWIDRSHFCGGSLISDQWIVTAAHCVDLQYNRHFKRITVSLGDHQVDVFDETENVFRKLKKIVRSPQYDNNFINGDLALLQLEKPVKFSDRIGPACLPYNVSEQFGYAEALITGWGYTEKTKILKPRPLTSRILMEAEVYILPQDLCVQYSPFPITERMICTFKGPLGVETTCQGDSGGPLVVNVAENKHVLVGAVSFGVSTCEGPYPSMFTRITRHMPFIHAAMVPSVMADMDYQTPADPSDYPHSNSTAVFNIF